MIIKNDQLGKFEKAYQDFVGVVDSLTPADFLRSLGDWTPRDIVAHLIGWNRNILIGCQQIQAGISPFYHGDGLNDYRTINAESIVRYDSTDRDALLRELAQGKDELTTFLRGVADQDWGRDFGVQHYRGGAATIGRSVESITRDYADHGQEISRGQAR
jgi:hypothetical protein